MDIRTCSSGLDSGTPPRPVGDGNSGDGASGPRESLIDYERLFVHSPDAILVVNAEGRYIEANAALCALTGYTRDELLTMRVGDLAPPQDRHLSEERFERLKQGDRARSEHLLRRKDGTTIPVDLNAMALGDGMYVVVSRDMSERANAATALQRSLRAYSTLLELCHAAVISAGPDGRIRSWNPGAEALFGFRAAEAVGAPLSTLIPPRLREKHQRSFEHRLHSSDSRPFTRILHAEGLRKDGSEVPIEIALAVGRHGDEPLFTAVVRDMSEHREVVERLNDALQRLQFHIQRMPFAYIVWDLNFRVMEWNPAAERIFGFARDEAMGHHAYQLIVPQDAQPAVDIVWRDLQQGDTSSHSNNANVRKDGSRLRCEWFNTPLRDSGGRIRGVASMAMDVSEREAVESRIREAQKLESLGVLAGGVAHDFNSSLMVILGNAALLRSVKGFPPRALEYIELIEHAGARADELIKHLLAYARTGRHNPQPTRLNTVIRDALMLVQSSIGKRHEIQVDLTDELPSILADHSQLAQIILNLCLNARDAMGGGGVIRIVTRGITLTAADAARCVPFDAKPGPYVEMLVADTGCGMDESTVRRMFEPFFTTKPDGHGLGMASVLSILRQHNAFAQVDSQLRVGTNIHVYFPVAPPAPQERPQTPTPHRVTNRGERAVPRRRPRR